MATRTTDLVGKFGLKESLFTYYVLVFKVTYKLTFFYFLHDRLPLLYHGAPLYLLLTRRRNRELGSSSSSKIYFFNPTQFFRSGSVRSSSSSYSSTYKIGKIGSID